MSNKQFSCVEMKRAAAEKIHNETHSMSLSEKLEYWKLGEAKLRKMINGSKKIH